MADNPTDKHLFALCFLNQDAKQPGEQDGSYHEEHKDRFAPSVEEQAGQEEESVFESPVFEEWIIVDQPDRWQKEKQKNSG